MVKLIARRLVASRARTGSRSMALLNASAPPKINSGIPTITSLSLAIQLENCMIICFNRCSDFPKCLTKKCDTETQFCDEDRGGVCQCKQGFFNKGTESALNCVKFDPCDAEHRNETACSDPKATCVSFGQGLDDFVCTCEEGYKAVKSVLRVFFV